MNLGINKAHSEMTRPVVRTDLLPLRHLHVTRSIFLHQPFPRSSCPGVTCNVKTCVFSRITLGSGQLRRSRCCWNLETFQSMKHPSINSASSFHHHHLIVIAVIVVITSVTTKYLVNPQIIVVKVTSPSLPSPSPSPW